MHQYLADSEGRGILCQLQSAEIELVTECAHKHTNLVVLDGIGCLSLDIQFQATKDEFLEFRPIELSVFIDKVLRQV